MQFPGLLLFYATLRAVFVEFACSPSDESIMASKDVNCRLPENISDDEADLNSTPSPQKRSKVQAPPDTPLTLGLLTQLLEQNLAKQTRELRDAQKMEMSRAFSQLEAKQAEVVRGIRMLRHSDRGTPTWRRGSTSSRQEGAPRLALPWMIRVVTTVSEAAVTTSHMEPGKHLWAAISRPTSEQQRAAHAGKLRKLLHTIGKNLISRTDTEYATGSLWLDEDLLGSSVKPRPADGSSVADGLVDIGRVAKISKLPERQVHEIWQQAIAGN